MPHPSKRKGTRFERELVDQARAAGLTAARAYASDGRAMGEAPTVDLKIAGVTVQAKRRKRIADYITPPKGAQVTAIRADRGETFVVMPFAMFIHLLKHTL